VAVGVKGAEAEGKDSPDEHVGGANQKKRPEFPHLTIPRPPPLLRQRD